MSMASSGAVSVVIKPVDFGAMPRVCLVACQITMGPLEVELVDESYDASCVVVRSLFIGCD